MSKPETVVLNRLKNWMFLSADRQVIDQAGKNKQNNAYLYCNSTLFILLYLPNWILVIYLKKSTNIPSHHFMAPANSQK